MKEGTAECHFSDESGNSGTIKLIFKNGNEIEAEIVYKTEGVSYYNTKTEKGERNGNYTFKVYNLKTYSRHFVATEEQMKTVELNGWGQVQLVAEVYDTGDHKIEYVYLQTEDGHFLGDQDY